MHETCAVRGPLGVAVVVGVAASLLFVNVHGQMGATVSISLGKWRHGWPATWLYREWRPFLLVERGKIELLDSSWPWIRAPGDWLEFRPLALLANALVAAAVLVGVAIGLKLGPGAWPLRVRTATALALVGLSAIVWLLATVFPGAVAPLADVCVYCAAAFAGYSILVRLLRRAQDAWRRSGAVDS